MESEKVQKARIDDPDRCQAITAKGNQCGYMSTDHSKYCVAHGGSAKRPQHNLLRTKWRADIQEYSDNPQIFNIKEEIGLTRLLLEKQLDACDTDVELLAHAPQLSDLLLKIEKLVTSCHKIEHSLGNYLSKTQLLNFANQVIAIISIHVKDPTLLDQIANEILGAYDGTDNS